MTKSQRSSAPQQQCWSAREDELRLSDLLSEFESAEGQESKSFFTTLTNNQEMQACIFRVLDRHCNSKAMTGNNADNVKRVCNMLLKFYRNLVSMRAKSGFLLASTASDLAKSRPVVYQYLAHVVALHLLCVQLNHEMKFLEALMLAVYNHEANDTQQTSQQQQSVFVRLPGLCVSSIYHESGRLDSEPTGAAGSNSSVILMPIFRPVSRVNASTRGPVIQLLFRALNRCLPDVSKFGTEQILNMVCRILERGHASHDQDAVPEARRIFLAAPVLVEMSYVAYFALYNGFHTAGARILELVEERGQANAWPSVMLVASAVRRLLDTSGPSQTAVTTSSVSTPGQLTKQMITNASFRAKKISDDIPKVLDEEEENGGPALGRMTSIIEETSNLEVEPKKTTGGGKASSKDKLKFASLKVAMKKEKSPLDADAGAKQPGSDTKASAIGKTDKKHRSSKFQLNFSSVQNVQATSVPDAGGSAAGSGSKGVALNGAELSAPGKAKGAKPIDSLEQVEELIQMKKLPLETISIHSPESGTTLF